MTTDSTSISDIVSPNNSGADRGMCLCLSGGGFRATLFHLGVVQRLNELGVLSRLSTITSVSGGSITNGVLASRWASLNLGPNGVFTNLDDLVVKPLREFCATDLRTAMLIGARLNPFNWPRLVVDRFSVSGNSLAEAYEPFFKSTLSDLPPPGPQSPRFIFCATNVRTGACWHFHGGPQARMGDFYNGYCDAGHVRVSDAVAASSAFPPGFSALRLQIPDGQTFSRDDPWGTQRVTSSKRPSSQAIELLNPILLTDGGVYDNLGVEPVWTTYNTLFVSDAGRPFESVDSSGQSLPSRLRRAADISMEQVAAVRKRWLVTDLVAGRRFGALWTLHTRLADFPISDKHGYDEASAKLIRKIRTDLDAFSEGEIACLENHGYSMADAAMRSYAAGHCPNLSQPFHWPHMNWVDVSDCAHALARSHKRKIIRDSMRYLFCPAPSTHC